MTERCENCEFWNSPDGKHADFGECDGGIPGDDNGTAPGAGAIAYIESSDEWTSRLFTKPGFACGMFAIRH